MRFNFGTFSYLRFAAPVVSLVIGALWVLPAVADDLVITNAWIRSLPVGSDAGYFTLKNQGSVKHVLIGASSPACAMLMLHKSTKMAGMGAMESMEDVANIPVPSGGEVKFEPNGYHLMCDKPQASVKPGATVSVTLTFADGTKTTAKFIVKNALGN